MQKERRTDRRRREEKGEKEKIKHRKIGETRTSGNTSTTSLRIHHRRINQVCIGNSTASAKLRRYHATLASDQILVVPARIEPQRARVVQLRETKRRCQRTRQPLDRSIKELVPCLRIRARRHNPQATVTGAEDDTRNLGSQRRARRRVNQLESALAARVRVLTCHSAHFTLLRVVCHCLSE